MPGQFTGTRGQAQLFIPALVREGMTNSEIVDFLRLNEFGYQAQKMFADVNRIRLEQFGAEQIRGMDIFTPIPENLMRTWEGDVKWKYRVVVQYEYTNPGGTEMSRGATTMYYNDRPSVNDVLEDFQIRTQTIEGGFGTPQDKRVIQGVQEINYFANRKKGR